LALNAIEVVDDEAPSMVSSIQPFNITSANKKTRKLLVEGVNNFI
jgi:hypothetical protein